MTTQSPPMDLSPAPSLCSELNTSCQKRRPFGILGAVFLVFSVWNNIIPFHYQVRNICLDNSYTYILYYIILYYIMLCYVILYYIIFYIILYYIILYYILYYIILYYIILYYIILYIHRIYNIYIYIILYNLLGCTPLWMDTKKSYIIISFVHVI